MTLNELDQLKQRADLMGITYKANIGVEALKKKINNHLDGVPDQTDDEGQPVDAAAPNAPAPAARVKSKAEIEQDIRKDQHDSLMRLVRVRVTCLNPAKGQIKGEIVTVANKYLGTVRKFIPFGEATDNGYHIPKILLDELRGRKFNSVTTKRGPNGQLLPIQRLVPEFAIEELPQLTQAELAKLAAAQMAVEGG